MKFIRSILQQFINDIDTGNSNISEKEEQEIIDVLRKLEYKELSKLEAADYIGVSRATFDNYVNKGFIPKGQKRRGLNVKFWNKYDLDKFMSKEKNE